MCGKRTSSAKKFIRINTTHDFFDFRVSARDELADYSPQHASNTFASVVTKQTKTPASSHMLSARNETIEPKHVKMSENDRPHTPPLPTNATPPFI